MAWGGARGARRGRRKPARLEAQWGAKHRMDSELGGELGSLAMPPWGRKVTGRLRTGAGEAEAGKMMNCRNGQVTLGRRRGVAASRAAGR